LKPVIIIAIAFVLLMGTITPTMAEEIPSVCANIKRPQIDPKMQGDIGLNNPQYMEAYREAENQYQQQMQKCIRDNQELSYSEDIESLLDKGHALTDEKKYAEALEQFDEVLEMTDHEIVQGKVFLAKAIIYFNMDEYETAVQYYDKVLEIEPEHAQALLHKGILYQVTKQNSGKNLSICLSRYWIILEKMCLDILHFLNKD